MRFQSLAISAFLLSSAISSVSLAQGSIASRITAAVGRHMNDGTVIPSMTPGCELAVGIVETDSIGLVELSLRDATTQVTFKGVEASEKNVVVEMDHVSAVSKYYDTDQDIDSTQSIEITGMSRAGIQGAKITINDNGQTKTCQF